MSTTPIPPVRIAAGATAFDRMSGLVRDRIGSASQALAARLSGLVLRIKAWWRRPSARIDRIGLNPSVDAATRLEISLRGGFPR